MTITADIVITPGAGAAQIAPCGFFFDLTGTTSTNTTKPFREMYCEADFDDLEASGAGNYAYGRQEARNIAIGMQVAHVYNRPDGSGDRTSTVAFRMTDGVETLETTRQATVYDPTGANGWASTYAVNRVGDADFTGAPAGATQQNTDSMTTIRGYLASGRRVLMKRGSSWNASPGANDVGNYLLGDYGGGAKPRIVATANNQILLGTGVPGGNKTGVRWVNLDFDGSTFSGVEAHSYLGGGNDATAVYKNWVLSGIVVNNCYGGISNYQNENVFFVDTSITTTYNGSIWYTSFNAGLYRSAVLGCYFEQQQSGSIDSGNGNWRLGDIWSKVILSSCTFHGAVAGRHVVKVHAPNTGVVNQYFILSGCKFTGGSFNSGGGTAGGWMVDFGPQSPGNNELLDEIVIERNWWAFSGFSERALVLQCPRVTVRNNLFDMSDQSGIASGSRAARAIAVEQRGGGSPIPTDCYFYNNTGYSSGSSTHNEGFSIVFCTGVVGANIVARNNYGSAPNFSFKQAVYDPNSVVTDSNNTLDDTPNFASGSPSAFADFKLGAGANLAIGQGTNVPVWVDAEGDWRLGEVYDLGLDQRTPGVNPFGGVAESFAFIRSGGAIARVRHTS